MIAIDDAPPFACGVAVAGVYLGGRCADTDPEFDDPVGRVPFFAFSPFGLSLLRRGDGCTGMPDPDGELLLYSVESGLSTQHSSVATHAPRRNGAGTPVSGSAQRQAASVLAITETA